MDLTAARKKGHRESHSGRKFQKKKHKKEVQTGDLEVSDKQRNPKAFALNSTVRAERRFRRKQDVETKKIHVPLVDRTPIQPPPILIAVVGPPKVGKTTLIHNLIKMFTKSPLTDINGPVTIVIGKKRRLTLIECNNDINSMIDLAKIADLVLLLCDASFGFEMEIFEFLNICQVHGMPRIMGILTHLDMIKNAKALKNTKKLLKHRFWTEVYAGAKLFYLSGIHHEEYLRNEIKNLGRFISVMKFRPLTWRTTHSYLLGDRYEDLTNQELIRKNPKCDRNVSLYGYIRGIPLNKNSSVHVAGLGDMKIHDISFLPDPCPLPDEIKKRALVEKEKLIYAPFSGVGGIVYDKDSVYVELGGSHSHQKRNDGELDKIVTNLIDSKVTLDAKIQNAELQIFTGSQKLTAKDFIHENDTDLIVSKDASNSRFEEKIEDSGRIRRKVIFSTSDEEMEENLNSDLEENSDQSDQDENVAKPLYTALRENKDADIHSKISDVLNQLNENKRRNDEESEETDCESNDDDDDGFSENDSSNEDGDGVKWKENLLEKAKTAFLNRQQTTQNYMKLVYGIFDTKSNQKTDTPTKSDNTEEIADMFTKVSHNQQIIHLEKDTMDLPESSLMDPWNSVNKNWLIAENKSLIANCFVTGKWKESEDASELLKLDDAEDLSDVNSELFGDFEDLETGRKHVSANGSGEKRKRDDENDEQTNKLLLAERKKKLKEQFDAEYDNTENNSFYDDLKTAAERQAQLNKTEFENMPDDIRTQIEGYRPGMYCRIEFHNVPAEFIANFDPTYPIVIGSINMSEENIGFVNVKIKKHRWYNRILKTNDSLIISLGWRRFQTIPIYSKLEDDLKFRYLKYTPEHLACNAHFWGPITPQGTGFLALQTVESKPEILKKQGFRIAATGTVQELDKSTRIMKKLKLIGYPLKIYKKTAFIKGMFNSALEVAKFEGARIKTVSGIRGQIKKAINKPEGCFRATFEDKIQLSDIVFCRTWYKVDVPSFYNPVTTLLLPHEEKNCWKGVRTTGELKREKGIKNTVDEDSLYKPIKREERPFKPLIIPRKLQKALPYKDKPKNNVKLNDKRKTINRVAVIKEPYEQKVTTLMKMVKAAYEHKQEKIKSETKERLEKHRQYIASEETRKEKKLKQKKKDVFRARSKAKIAQEKKS